MAIHVVLVDDAIEDLNGYVESGNLKLFLKRLVRLEEVGADAGKPLGRGLATFRKIVVGNRDWRIIYEMSADGSTATVWVIGDRSDEACYETALARLEAAPETPHTATLATMLAGLLERRADRRR